MLQPSRELVLQFLIFDSSEYLLMTAIWITIKNFKGEIGVNEARKNTQAKIFVE